MRDEASGATSRARGAALAILTGALLATQEPLAGPAAQKLSPVAFILVTQCALALSTPFLLFETGALGDLRAILASAASWRRLAALTLVGLAGLALNNLGLAHANAVVVAAILNLSPFWAALVARLVSGVSVPAGPLAFAFCLAAAFAGATLVAYSQSPAVAGGLWAALGKGSWYFAIPVPAFTALSGTLIELWFKPRRDSAAVVASLWVSSLAVIPVCALYLWSQGGPWIADWRYAALLALGALLASSLGRLTYQFALRDCGDDNGFVTMFFLLATPLSSLYAFALSTWIPGLKFTPSLAFFAGLAVTAAALFAFARRARVKA